VVKNTYKMEHLEGSLTPVLYIGRTVLNAVYPFVFIKHSKEHVIYPSNTTTFFIQMQLPVNTVAIYFAPL